MDRIPEQSSPYLHSSNQELSDVLLSFTQFISTRPERRINVPGYAREVSTLVNPYRLLHCFRVQVLLNIPERGKYRELSNDI